MYVPNFEFISQYNFFGEMKNSSRHWTPFRVLWLSEGPNRIIKMKINSGQQTYCKSVSTKFEGFTGFVLTYEGLQINEVDLHLADGKIVEMSWLWRD